MDNEKKMYLEKLKKENKERQKKINVKNNILLKECLDVLADNAVVLNDKEHETVYSEFKKNIPFSPWGIDWSQFDIQKSIIESKQLVNSCINKRFYIIWGKELPIIECDLPLILECLDDITAVESDTWLLGLDFSEVIEFYHEGKIKVGQISK